MEIGKKIKDLRIQKNLTQEELADRCEMCIRDRFLYNPFIALHRSLDRHDIAKSQFIIIWKRMLLVDQDQLPVIC